MCCFEAYQRNQLPFPLKGLITSLFLLCNLFTIGQQPFYQNFSVEDGLPSATVYDIEQDHNGFIWFGTEAGVARFDGLSFTTFSKENGLADNEVFDIYEDYKGRIWFYPFNKKLSYFYKGEIYNEENDSLLRLQASGYYKSGFPLPNGALLIGSTGKNLIYIADNFSCVIPTMGSPMEFIRFQGNTLIYSDYKKAYSLKLDLSEDCPVLIEEQVLDSFQVSPQKQLHFATYSPTDSITDEEGNVWISTLGNGVFMQTYEGVYFLNDKTGLSHKNVYSIAQTRDKLLAGYKNGSLDIIEYGKIENVHLSEEIYNRVLRLEGSENVYAATDRALLTLTSDFKVKNKQLGAIKCLDDEPEQLYVGTYIGLYAIDKSTGDVKDKLYNKRTLAVCADHQDTIWIGTNTGLFYYANDTALSYAENHPEVSGRIKGLEYIYDRLIVGTHGEGLLVQNGNSFDRITVKNGLVSNLCNVLYKQNDSTLWLGSNAGLNRLRFRKDQMSKPLIDLFTTSNGLISNYINDIKVRGNKAYVATDKGITFFNLLVKDKKVNPEVYIKRVLINEKDTNIESKYKLTYDQDQVEIHFSAIAFKSGNNTKFRYRLRGHSDEWHTGSKTFIAYEALAPKEYTFQVYALTSDGEKSKEPAIVSFTIAPPFWKTWWFRLLGLFNLALSIIGITRLIIQYNRRKDMEEKNKLLSEKNEIIEEQRQRSEELLLNILPEDTARELQENGKVIAKSHDYATVFFSDFKGFTEIASQVTPEQLVAELDYCFSGFDAIMDKHGIEKIKTIGDAYMCATGLNKNTSDKVSDMVNAALDVVSFMNEYESKRKLEGKPYFEIRIGIHVGKVVSGVVGSRKFAYDIWGDTVNTAARMESSGEVGRVNVSKTTYEIIKEEYACIPRGLIKAKGKGEMEMYFVEGKV